jgi:UDP:flavonoid glycosyltransferase YjiC (YdhE family)
VQAGWAQVAVEDDEVLTIGDVAHEWLFPQMAAAVHHAGAGTTGAALRAGLPAVTVPVMADQPFWAERVHALQAGPAPIPFADLSAPTLADTIRAALDQPVYRSAAQRLAAFIRAEDGARTVARRIEQLVD